MFSELCIYLLNHRTHLFHIGIDTGLLKHILSLPFHLLCTLHPVLPPLCNLGLCHIPPRFLGLEGSDPDDMFLGLQVCVLRRFDLMDTFGWKNTREEPCTHFLCHKARFPNILFSASICRGLHMFLSCFHLLYISLPICPLFHTQKFSHIHGYYFVQPQ